MAKILVKQDPVTDNIAECKIITFLPFMVQVMSVVGLSWVVQQSPMVADADPRHSNLAVTILIGPILTISALFVQLPI